MNSESTSLLLSGRAFGGQQPISNAAIQLYAIGTTGNGSPATPLLAVPVYTDANGEFKISETRSCPSTSSQLYITASGGNPGLQAGTDNPQSVLMALVGTCGDLASDITINEITTLAAVYAMAPFITAYNQIGTSSANVPTFNNAVTFANELANFSTGTSPGPDLQQGVVDSVQKLNALANLLAGCVNSSGGVSGDGTPCGTLFSTAAEPDGTTLTNTFDASLKIAQNPTRNVAALFPLSQSSSLFQPALTVIPPDWTLSIISTIPEPTFSPTPGTYNGPQSVALSDPDPTAAIYYTTDGSAPSASSTRYTGAIPVPVTSTIRAVATDYGLNSVPAAGTYTISSPVTVGLSPSDVTLGPSQAEAFSAIVVGSTDSAVTWSLNPAVGSISTTGLYTAPAAIASPQSVTVTATEITFGIQATATVDLQSTPPTLRSIASSRGILVGAAADGDEYGQQSPLTHNPTYAKTLSSQYDLLEPENAMKWQVIGANQGSYNFEPADGIVAFAEQNSMAVRGHNLCWWQQNPAWLSNLSSAQLYQTLHDYIFAVMGHYRGKVFAWDVVNEAISNDATATNIDLNEGVWYKQPGIGLSGTGYIEQAFRWAHEADPTAKLFYNDHGIETLGGKQQALLAMLTDFLSRGVPIDGVGFEMHIDPTTNYPTTFPQALKAVTDLGLQVHITELDVRLPVNAEDVASDSELAAQAATYSFVVNTCLQNPLCTVIQTWGFGDKWSWITKEFPGYGAALPFDLSYKPKPAYYSILQDLQTGWVDSAIRPGGSKDKSPSSCGFWCK